MDNSVNIRQLCKCSFSSQQRINTLNRSEMTVETVKEKLLATMFSKMPQCGKAHEYIYHISIFH
jgi:hypothetical protein